MILKSASLKASIKRQNKMVADGKQALDAQKEDKPKKRTTKMRRKAVKRIETKDAVYTYVEVERK